MNKKTLFLFLILVFSLSEMGCASSGKSIREKFRRKKKNQEQEATQLIRVGEEETYPNKVMYKMHYVYWDAWMTALINYLGQSPKKDLANCRRVLEDLDKMSSLLKEDKALLLEPYTKKLNQVKKQIMLGRVNSEANRKVLKRKIKEVHEEVRRMFNPEKMDEGWIKTDSY